MGEFKLGQNMFLKSNARPLQVNEKELHKIVQKPKSFEKFGNKLHRLWQWALNEYYLYW